MPIEAYEELQAIREQKKQSAPITSTSTGQAVTPPTTAPVVSTGAFGSSPIVSKQPTVPATQPATYLMKGPTGQIDPTTQFWANLGAPQYIGRYAPFPIPSGYKVSSMVEQNNQLKIMFASTRPSIGNPATLMKTWEAFALQAQQDAVAPSREVNPILMKNLEKLHVEGPQNLLDLQAKTASVTSEAFKERVIESAKLSGRPEPVFSLETPKSEYQKLLLSSPGAARMYESAIVGGRPAPTFTLTTIARKQAALTEPYPIDQFPETGNPNDLVDWFNSQRVVGADGKIIIPPESIQKPSLRDVYQQYHDVRMPGLLKGESETFYKNIGYPQYGGLYAPFDIPAGTTIQDITRTPQGLQVTFKYLPQTQTQTAIIGKSPLNVGQTVTIQRQPLPEVIPSLTGWLLGQSKEAAKYEQIMGPSPLTSSRRFETLAGFVASGESLINPRTPFVVSPAFIGGYIFGAAVTGYAIGKVVQPIVQPITQAIAAPVQSKATTWLTKSYEESVRAGELWKPSLTERIVMGVTGARPTDLPRSVIGLPTLIEEAPAKAATSNRLDVRGLQATLGLGPEEAKQLPSLIAGEDIFEFTNAPRTVGFGYTVPLPEATKTVAVASLETFGLPAPALSSIVAKWFTPIDHGVMPKQELGFSKQPQTYRPAEESALSFSKQYGAFPTQSGLLEQIVRQEAKAIAVSRGMPNVFGPAVTTVQKTATPFIPITLGEMTSWLVSQETRTKTVQASAITPLSVTFQPQGKTKQIDETQYVTYPGQPLTVNVPTRETTKTSILDVEAGLASLGKQGIESVQSLPLLEKQVQQITQPQKPLVSNVLISPLLETAIKREQKTVSPLLTLSGLTESNVGLNLFPNIMPKGIVTPSTGSLIISRMVQPSPKPISIMVPPKESIVPPKLFDLPKMGGGGTGPREPSSLLYPFGRQKRKYPVMTGQQVAKFLFSGKTETKRRKKK